MSLSLSGVRRKTWRLGVCVWISFHAFLFIVSLSLPEFLLEFLRKFVQKYLQHIFLEITPGIFPKFLPRLLRFPGSLAKFLWKSSRNIFPVFLSLFLLGISSGVFPRFLSIRNAFQRFHRDFSFTLFQHFTEVSRISSTCFSTINLGVFLIFFKESFSQWVYRQIALGVSFEVYLRDVLFFQLPQFLPSISP